MVNNQNDTQSQNGGTGRTNNTGTEPQNQQQGGNEKRDISNMDQQEGNLNHGETGGNMSQPGQGTSSNPDE